MTIEERLKDYILTKYKSIREFTLKANIPYSTVDTILKRGVPNASIGNILKICSALNISADELANGNIVPVENRSDSIDVGELLLNYQINDRINFELDGKPLTTEELVLLFDSLEVSLEIIRRRRRQVDRLTAYAEGFSRALKNIEDEKKVNGNDSAIL
jgi:hypothetical protein